MAEFELKWAVGTVKCQKCGYRWVAAFPVGASELECPKCGEFEGKAEICERKDDENG